jgi:hypothetical protein
MTAEFILDNWHYISTVSGDSNIAPAVQIVEETQSNQLPAAVPGQTGAKQLSLEPIAQNPSSPA